MQPTRDPAPRLAWVVAYFRSGWAFLIPYLAAYFLYAWLKWPVNAGAGEGSMEKGAGSGVPCLLHVYWVLHAVHVTLAGVALVTWWRKEKGEWRMKEAESSRQNGERNDEVRDEAIEGPPPASLLPSPSSLLRQRALRGALPWLGLALLFWIPGVYMEFPADPWQHYARLNEWSWHDLVTQHSYWEKSSYFLGYSFIGHVTPPLLQLKWFDVYYTGCCLLLCWQYYRLARAVGLSERASLLFVLLQALVFGNNLFGFYRYYGMSSTVFAQLGAVAMTRVALEALGATGRRENGERRKEKAEIRTQNAEGNEGRTSPSIPPSPSSLLGSPSSFLPPASGLFAYVSRAMNRENVGQTPGRAAGRNGASPLLPSAFSFLLLLALTVGNHKQGALIAGAGVAAVITWRLIEWRRSTIGWLALIAVVASVAVILWWPRHPLIDSNIRPEGWMTSWYAFNLFQPSSAGFQRAWVMIGAVGGVNLIAGLWLLRRNHVAGWLTLMPVLLLCLPCFALPFANTLAASTDLDGGYIIAFHRLLLAVPMGLAMTVWWNGGKKQSISREEVASRERHGTKGRANVAASIFRRHTLRPLPFVVLLIILSAFTTLPAGGPVFNRLYSDLLVPADDLSMSHIVRSPLLEEIRREAEGGPAALDPELAKLERGRVLALPGIAYVLNSTGITRIVPAWRPPEPPEVSDIVGQLQGKLSRLRPGSLRFASFSKESYFYSPWSLLGMLSGHWPPMQVALEHAAQPELFASIQMESPPPQIWLQWFSPRDHAQVFGRGAGREMTTPPLDERGRLDAGKNNQQILAGDLVILQPVMRTYDGSGWRLVLAVQGPGTFFSREIQGKPSPQNAQQWISEDQQIKVDQPGRYDVEIRGTTLWPTQQWTARYHFIVQPVDASGNQ